MQSSPNDILAAALALPEADRLMIATRLLATLPDDCPGLAEDAPGFLDELERRANDPGPTVPAAELWNQD